MVSRRELFVARLSSWAWRTYHDVEIARICIPSLDAHQSDLCWRLRLRQDGNTEQNGGRSSPQVSGSSQATKRLEGVDQRASSRLSLLGRVRTKSVDDCRQRSHPLRCGPEVRAWWQGLAFRASTVPALWTDDSSVVSRHRRPLCVQCGTRSVR